MRRYTLLIFILLMMLISTQAQDGRGLVRVGLQNNLDEGFTSFNPLRCGNFITCVYMQSLLFPSLLAVDHETAWYTEGTADNNALAANWSSSEDNLRYTFNLREDAFWSDGQPITAYDYLYTYLALTKGDESDFPYRNRIRGLSENVLGIVPISDTQFIALMNEPVCDHLNVLNIPIIPAHAFDSNFTNEAATFFENGGDANDSWATWDDNFDYDFSLMVNHPFDEHPSITGGDFEFVEWQRGAHIRLQQGDVALEFVPVGSTDNDIDRFIAGELDVLPFALLFSPERAVDIDNAPFTTVHDLPSGDWTYIAFNLADPREPKSAFDEDSNPIEQIPHPILSNPDVRRAIQLGVNVEALIEIALYGHGTALGTVYSPLSWAHDDSAITPEYNPDEAQRLLNEAGWVHVNGRSVRECVNCGTAPDGWRLELHMNYASQPHHGISASLVQQQLRQIGINISASQTGFDGATDQTFDLYLGSWFDNYPAAPGTYTLFDPASDIVGSGNNFVSYNNPDVQTLHEEARTLAGCGLAERQALYSEAEALLQDDLPYMSLYSSNLIVGLQGSIQNVELRPNDPFWNLADWLVFDATN